MGLWTIPEMASGFLAVCLPVSPKFFRSLKESTIISRLEASLRSLLHPSRNEDTFPSENKSSGNEAAKLWKGPSNTEAKSNKYIILGEPHEMVPTPRKGGAENNLQDEHLTKSSQVQQANNQIFRTIQIATSNDPVHAPIQNAGNGAEASWY
jgi:hypothetical protein